MLFKWDNFTISQPCSPRLNWVLKPANTNDHTTKFLILTENHSFSIFSFISVVLERCPDDEEVRNILKSINTNIQEQKKGKKGKDKKNSKRVGTSSCLPDPTENISRIFKDFHYDVCLLIIPKIYRFFNYPAQIFSILQ